MKIVTTAAALENGITDLVVDCTGSAIIVSQKVTCPHQGGHGREDLTSAFEDSCNIYFAELADRVGASQMTTVADSFLFNFHWDFADFSVLESNYKAGSNAGDLAWSGIGQYRDLITPLHNMLISASVATGGTMMEPQTLLDVRYGGRSAYNYVPNRFRTLMRPDTATTLTNLMRNTVLQGTATSANIGAAAVCGKTGTAEYTDDGEIKNHSWFVGFSQDPEHPLAVAVILEGAGFGSAHATPLAGKVLSRAIELGY